MVSACNGGELQCMQALRTCWAHVWVILCSHRLHQDRHVCGLTWPVFCLAGCRAEQRGQLWACSAGAGDAHAGGADPHPQALRVCGGPRVRVSPGSRRLRSPGQQRHRHSLLLLTPYRNLTQHRKQMLLPCCFSNAESQQNSRRKRRPSAGIAVLLGNMSRAHTEISGAGGRQRAAGPADNGPEAGRV